MLIKKADYIIGGTKFEHFPKDNKNELLFVPPIMYLALLIII